MILQNMVEYYLRYFWITESFIFRCRLHHIWIQNVRLRGHSIYQGRKNLSHLRLLDENVQFLARDQASEEKRRRALEDEIVDAPGQFLSLRFGITHVYSKEQCGGIND